MNDTEQRVSAEAVRAAYRSILGREPENEDVVRWHVQHATSLEGLLRTFINCEEFKCKTSSGTRAVQVSLLELLSHFTPRRVVGHAKIRVGNKTGDGGYVMLDDFGGIAGALSAGIGGDVSWDQEIADRGIDVYQFDHTVIGPPVFHERFHFFRHEISSDDHENSESIRSMIAKVPTAAGGLLFKIDIEGAEWKAFDAADVSDFSRIAQLVCEFHGFSNASRSGWRERAVRVMVKLNSIFQVVHVHGNNWAPFHVIANVPVTDVIEVTFVNRSIYQFEDTAEIYPTSIDRPNAEHRPDIFLGSMRFANFERRVIRAQAGIMRIIASMTTIPSRIDRIRPALESVLAQTVPIEHIEMNIPYICARKNEPYVLPKWLEDMDQIKIFRTEDYGPITKVAPTFLRYRHDRETYIWSVDDDIAYPANQLYMLCHCHCPEERRILARRGGIFHPDGSVAFMFGRLEVSMFEGFGTVLYPPACIGDDFSEYIKMTSENIDCRKSDDVVLSRYFSSRGLPIYLCNQLSETEPYDLTGWLPQSSDKDALSSQDGGHLERYKRVFEFLNSLSPSST